MKRLVCSAALALLFSVPAGCGKKADAPAPAPAAAEPAVAAPAPAEPAPAEPAPAEPAPAEPVVAEPAPAEPVVPAAPADGAVAVPNASGLLAIVPANAVPNGIGGAAGFHSEDGTFQFALRALEGEEAAQTLDQFKAGLNEIMEITWKRSDTTEDGWITVYELPKIDVVDGEAKIVGTVQAFSVRRKIGGKLYDCSGGLDRADGIDASIAACQSVRAE